MSVMALAAMPTIIKPDDLVRTRDGRITARCIEILPHHYRRLQNVLTGARFMAHVDDLVVIQAAVPRPWPKERR